VDIAIIQQIKKGMWLNRRYKTLMHYFKGYKIEKNGKWGFTILRVQLQRMSINTDVRIQILISGLSRRCNVEGGEQRSRWSSCLHLHGKSWIYTSVAGVSYRLQGYTHENSIKIQKMKLF